MKRLYKILLLCLVFALLLGGYALVLRMNARTVEVAEESGSFALIEREADALTGLRWGDCDFIRQDGAWVNADDASFPVDQATMDDLAERFLTLEANRKLTDVVDVSVYGISEDSFSVTASWSDGGETVYALGDATPFDDGYYLQCSDDAGAVYATPSALDAVFAESLTDLAAWEEIPKVESANRLAIGATLDVVRSEDENRFDPGQDWYDAATGEPMDDAGIEEVLSTLTGLSWQELLTVSATESELSEWQLDDTNATVVTASGDDGQECALLLGGEDADGDRYARLPGSGMVYAISADSANRLLAATGDNLRSAELFTIESENVKEFTAMLDGQEHSFEMPDGTEAEALWERIAALNSSGRSEDVPAGEALFELYVTNASGASLSCAFYAHDVASYVAALSDGRVLLVPADDVDALIRALRQA